MTNDGLVISCSHGDEKAIEILYRTYHENLFRVCLKYASNEYDACDYMHDGFIHILNKIKTVNPESVTSLGGWLCTVMRNFILDQIRANKKQIYCDFEDKLCEHEQEDEFVINISHNTLLDLVETLTPQFKKVFIMYAIDEKQHKDIAKELNISESTSKTNYHRARKILKKRLGELKLI